MKVTNKYQQPFHTFLIEIEKVSESTALQELIKMGLRQHGGGFLSDPIKDFGRKLLESMEQIQA